MGFLMDGDGNIKGGNILLFSIGVIVFFFLFFGILAPLLKPWWAEQSGKAEYAQAEQNRRIAILEATAKEESAKHLAQAEVNRADGVAKANKIIGESLKDNEAYLRYLWIIDVAGANLDKTVVYIPTETNIPILEASRFQKYGGELK